METQLTVVEACCECNLREGNSKVKTHSFILLSDISPAALRFRIARTGQRFQLPIQCQFVLFVKCADGVHCCSQ